jgi:hypothetical protein
MMKMGGLDRFIHLDGRTYAVPHAFSVPWLAFRRFGIMMKPVNLGEETQMQMEKTVKIAAGLAVTLVALGIIANFKDIKRYWRICMM